LCQLKPTSQILFGTVYSLERDLTHTSFRKSSTLKENNSDLSWYDFSTEFHEYVYTGNKC